VRRSLLFPLTLLLALAVAVPALAGGFATAGISTTPAGVEPGEPWNADITVMRHGLTPMDGLTPLLRIRSGDTTREFAAKPTGQTGVYRAVVVFPTAGKWEYEVIDGFRTDVTHTFPAVEIASAGGGSTFSASWLWGAGAALAAAVAVLALDRRRRAPGLRPEPAA
jgi:hypothetical protein